MLWGREVETGQDELVGHVTARAGAAGHGGRPLRLLTGRMTRYPGTAVSSAHRPHQCPRAWRAVWALAGIGKVGGGRQRPALDFMGTPGYQYLSLLWSDSSFSNIYTAPPT